MSGRRRTAALVAAVATSALVYFWLRDTDARSVMGLDETDEVSVVTALPEVTPAPRFATEAPIPPAAPPPPTPAGRPDEPRRDPGFCPEPGEARVPYPRPGLAQLLNERTDELVARARLLSRGRGSEALRRGLTLLNQRGHGVEAISTLARAPDRNVDGFDFASAAAVAAGARALAAGEDVQQIIAEALRVAPDDGIVHVLAAHDARHRRDEIAARRALAEALVREPEEPAIAVALGRALSNTPDDDGALAALRVYLAAYDDDVQMARLAALLELRRDLTRDFRRIDRGGVSLRYDTSFPDDAARATLRLAVDVLAEAARLLGVVRRPELAIVVYGSSEELRAVTCVPGWAGGVYDGTLRLSRTTIAEDRGRRRVVRHEGLHAALGAAAGRTPYWFNEGLAQRFAHERGGAHRASWARIRRSGMTIPLSSLDGSFLDIDDPDDARLAYHQSLAMVDLLVARRGERVFSEAVTYLSGGGDQAALLETLSGARPISSADLVEFLRAE